MVLCCKEGSCGAAGGGEGGEVNESKASELFGEEELGVWLISVTSALRPTSIISHFVHHNIVGKMCSTWNLDALDVILLASAPTTPEEIFREKMPKVVPRVLPAP